MHLTRPKIQEAKLTELNNYAADKQKIENLSNTINQPDIADIYRTFYTSGIRLFSGRCGISFRIDNMLGHKTSK